MDFAFTAQMGVAIKRVSLATSRESAWSDEDLFGTADVDIGVHGSVSAAERVSRKWARDDVIATVLGLWIEGQTPTNIVCFCR